MKNKESLSSVIAAIQDRFYVKKYIQIISKFVEIQQIVMEKKC